jgi:hypothetical protein
LSIALISDGTVLFWFVFFPAILRLLHWFLPRTRSLPDSAYDISCGASGCTGLTELHVQTALYKQPGFQEHGYALMNGLVWVLLNGVWDTLKGPLLDVLWSLGSCDWSIFVGKLLPKVCGSGGEAMRMKTASLIQPFVSDAGSLNDFAHFSACMDAFVNDARFFERLTTES